ncbi:ribosome-associated translation inhibitor RaiA [Candidatus Kaiserbacteria bacterium]|nr:ribosome-associated translation inhibitor RaiA [Candidatus Kaiserbacteria bacterium]MCB9811969.1 ribosome-associated translation inhibitor RaiA [Candidatus Nomurabacteria bacterium]
MAFPIINFKVGSDEVTEAHKELATSKLSSLERHITGTATVCDVEFEKITNQQSGNVYRVETNLSVDGKLYRAEATSDSFEKAIDMMRNEIDKEIRRASSKRETLFKRGGRKIKEMLNFGG